MSEEKILRDAVLVYLLRNDQILLALKSGKIGSGRRNGYGGGIEDGETERESAVRELKEESEVIASPEALEKVAILDFHNIKEDGEKFICTVHVFFLRTWIGTPKETSTMRQPRWYNIRKLPLSFLMPADREWLPQVIAGKKIVGTAYYGPFQRELLKPAEIREVEILDE